MQKSMKTPTFIVGCSRAGTTIVQACLASSSAVFTFPETQLPFGFFSSPSWRMFGTSRKEKDVLDQFINRFFIKMNDMGICRNNYIYLLNKMRHDALHISSIEAAKRKFCLRDAFRLYRHSIECACEPSTWIEKSPRNIFVIDEIQRYMPDAQFVHVVRSGEETIASLIDAGRKFEDFKSRFGGEDGIAAAVEYWNNAIIKTRDVKNDRQHMIVHYDEFIQDPENNLKAICRFIGVPYEDGLVSPNLDLVVNKAEPWKRSYGQNIGTPREKFSTLFTDVEKTFIRKNLVLGSVEVSKLSM